MSGPRPDGELPLRQRLRRDLARSAANMKVVGRDDGLHQVELVQGFRHATLRVRAADGGLSQRCTSHAGDALRALELASP